MAGKGIDILLKEYEELFNEIRNIHEKRMAMFKILLSLFLGFLGFIFAGVILYIRSKEGVDYHIPLSIAYCYSALGIILGVILYLILFGMWAHIGSSKKHTVRYWKAIHAIRLGLKNLEENVGEYLILPDTQEKPLRPEVSKKWMMGMYIYPLFNIMFAILVAFLAIPFFCTPDIDKGFVMSRSKISELTKSATAVWPFLMSALAGGTGEMRRFWENIQLAKLIRRKNIFPRKSSMYTKDTSKIRRAKMIRISIRILHFSLVITSFIFSTYVLYLGGSNLVGSEIWWYIIILSPTFTIFLVYVYLKTFSFLVDHPDLM